MILLSIMIIIRRRIIIINKEMNRIDISLHNFRRIQNGRSKPERNDYLFSCHFDETLNGRGFKFEL